MNNRHNKTRFLRYRTMKYRAPSIGALILSGLMHLLPGVALSQPSGLSASYKKYANRIELRWEANGTQHRYIIQRREKTQKAFTAIDTVAQNRYIDRNRLRANMEYYYRVQSISPDGITSAPGKEAVGALLVMANEHRTGQDTAASGQCLQLRFAGTKATATLYSVRFMAEYACTVANAATITLYYSEDDTLDPHDTILAQQSFAPPRSRGAFAVRNSTGATKGFAVLKVESEGQVTTLSASWGH